MAIQKVIFVGNDDAAVSSTGGGLVSAVGGTWTYQSTHTRTGLGKSIRTVNPGTGLALIRTALASLPRVATGFLVNLSAPPSGAGGADLFLGQLEGGTYQNTVQARLNDEPRVNLAGNSANVNPFPGTGIVVPSGSTDIWVSMYAKASASQAASDGEYRCALFAGDSQTPFYDTQLLSNVVTASAGVFGNVRQLKNSSGNYTGTLFATGPHIYSDTDVTTVVSPPWASAPVSASLAVSPSTGPSPLQVTATASNPAGGTSSNYRYAWDWGDGSGVSAPSTSPTATHTYTTQGSYTVSLYVTTV